MSLTAPFPWYGGKRRIAAQVWERFGEVGVYVEPFAGSLAVLLHRATAAAREVVCDTDGGLCNFWRAVRWAPDEVAYWADWPTVHDDLTARHAWLVEWCGRRAGQLSRDPEYFDAKAAGWWVWGASLWIGSEWCHRAGRPGVGAQRRQVPYVGGKGGGQGVAAQRRQVPNMGVKCGGRGVGAQRTSRPDLVAWMRALAGRLEGVVVLNRPWGSAVTDTVLQQTPSAHKPPVGVFLDPPYIGTSTYGDGGDAAAEAFRWAIDHGDRHRVAYCAHAGDFAWPAGWDVDTRGFTGIRDPARRDATDLVAYSPACLPPAQSDLFHGSER